MKSYRIGIDEAGRGCVYGPLAVGGVCRTNYWSDDRVDDSKKLKPVLRDCLAPLIRRNCLWAVAMVHAVQVEAYGISKCLEAAGDAVMKDLVAQVLAFDPDAPVIRVVFDGDDRDDQVVDVGGVGVEVCSIIKGDQLVFECSAASILAKTDRDHWVLEQVAKDPALDTKYDLSSSKGYGTEKHRDGIIRHGLTPHHRPLFCHSLTGNWLEKQAKIKQKEKHGTAHPTTTTRPGNHHTPVRRTIGL